MDPKLVVSQLGANAEALAITSIVLGGATGPPVVSSMSVTSVQGHTRDITAPNSQEHHGRPGIGIETIQGVDTREPLTPHLPGESEAFTGSLPTPVNVNSLERVLVDHPDRLRYGADIGYKGPRVPRFSRNLPTALHQPHVVTANVMKEVALVRVAGPFPTPPFPNLQVSPIGRVPKKQQIPYNFPSFLS